MRPREKLYVLGNSGSGKSTAPLTIAENQPQSKVHIINNDGSVESLLYHDKNFAKLTNVYIHDCYDWTTMANLQLEVGPEDWVVWDSFGNLWDMCQNAWIEMRHPGVDGSDFRTQLAVEGKPKFMISDDPKTNSVDWNAVKSVYDNYIRKWFRIPRCNLMALSGVKSMDGMRPDSKTEDITSQFNSIGHVPMGRSGSVYLFHNVIYLSYSNGRYYLEEARPKRGSRSAKFMERRDITGKSFFSQYIVHPDGCGWQL